MLQTAKCNSCYESLSVLELHGESFSVAGCFTNRLVFLLKVSPWGQFCDGDDRGGGHAFSHMRPFRLCAKIAGNLLAPNVSATCTEKKDTFTV